jgi:hypothetical protein
MLIWEKSRVETKKKKKKKNKQEKRLATYYSRGLVRGIGGGLISDTQVVRVLGRNARVAEQVPPNLHFIQRK